MTKCAALLSLAGLVLAGGHAQAEAPRQQVLACQTVNDHTSCWQGNGGSLSCVTVNGNTTCTGSGLAPLPLPPPSRAWSGPADQAQSGPKDSGLHLHGGGMDLDMD